MKFSSVSWTEANSDLVLSPSLYSDASVHAYYRNSVFLNFVLFINIFLLDYVRSGQPAVFTPPSLSGHVYFSHLFLISPLVGISDDYSCIFISLNC